MAHSPIQQESLFQCSRGATTQRALASNALICMSEEQGRVDLSLATETYVPALHTVHSASHLSRPGRKHGYFFRKSSVKLHLRFCMISLSLSVSLPLVTNAAACDRLHSGVCSAALPACLHCELNYSRSGVDEGTPPLRVHLSKLTLNVHCKINEYTLPCLTQKPGHLEDLRKPPRTARTAPQKRTCPGKRGRMVSLPYYN